MADIRVTSTGRIFFQVDGTLAAVLCEAFPAAFERVFEGMHPHERAQAMAKPVDTTTPNFFVRKNPYSGKPELVMTLGALEEIYNGPADKIPTFGGKAQRECPLEVQNAYRVAMGQEIMDPVAYHAQKAQAANGQKKQPAWPRY
jgi:hypothetical protein